MKNWMLLLALAAGLFAFAGPQSPKAEAHGWYGYYPRPVYYAPRRVVYGPPVYAAPIYSEPVVVAAPGYPVYSGYPVTVVRRPFHAPRIYGPVYGPVYASPYWGW